MNDRYLPLHLRAAATPSTPMVAAQPSAPNTKPEPTQIKMGEPNENLGTIPPTISEQAVLASFGGFTLPPRDPAMLPHVRFKMVRDRLLVIEQDKKEGKSINLKEVQSLVSEAAALTAEIQTSTTGPKKNKAVDENGNIKEKKPKKEKKKSSIEHLNIPEGDDF